VIAAGSLKGGHSAGGRTMKARDLVNAGESAVAIFTRGGRFVLRDDGTGSVTLEIG
jgi:hypothetical protein